MCHCGGTGNFRDSSTAVRQLGPQNRRSEARSGSLQKWSGIHSEAGLLVLVWRRCCRKNGHLSSSETSQRTYDVNGGKSRALYALGPPPSLSGLSSLFSFLFRPTCRHALIAFRPPTRYIIAGKRACFFSPCENAYLVRAASSA